MSLEATIETVGAYGLLVNNLYQTESYLWHSSLRSPECNEKGEFYHEFGRGPTPDDALNAALAKALDDFKTEEYQGRKKNRPAVEAAAVEQEIVVPRTEEEIQGELGLEQVSWEDL